MRATLVTIDHDRLLRVPENERIFVFGLGHAANEVNVFQKLLYWTQPSDVDEPLLNKAESTQALSIARVLGGKLFEGWEFVRKTFFSTKLCDVYEPLLDDEGKKALLDLKRYFRSSSRLARVRNLAAFHYTTTQLDAGFKRAPSNEDWSIVVSESAGNTLFYAADMVANYALTELGHATDHAEGLQTIVNDLVIVSRRFVYFATSCWFAFVFTHLRDSDGDLPVSQVDIDGAPTLDSVHVPFFVSLPTDAGEGEDGRGPSVSIDRL